MEKQWCTSIPIRNSQMDPHRDRISTANQIGSNTARRASSLATIRQFENYQLENLEAGNRILPHNFRLGNVKRANENTQSENDEYAPTSSGKLQGDGGREKERLSGAVWCGMLSRCGKSFGPTMWVLKQHRILIPPKCWLLPHLKLFSIFRSIIGWRNLRHYYRLLASPVSLRLITL